MNSIESIMNMIKSEAFYGDSHECRKCGLSFSQGSDGCPKCGGGNETIQLLPEFEQKVENLKIKEA